MILSITPEIILLTELWLNEIIAIDRMRLIFEWQITKLWRVNLTNRNNITRWIMYRAIKIINP